MTLEASRGRQAASTGHTSSDRQASSSKHDKAASRDELSPIPPAALGIARLARGHAGTPGGEARGNGKTQSQLTVGLYRRNLGIHDDAAYFRLKMGMLRMLRKRLDVQGIDIDDVDGLPQGEEAFEMRLDPPDAAVLARARSVAARILRTGRWRQTEV